jgi:hypothetical protein
VRVEVCSGVGVRVAVGKKSTRVRVLVGGGVAVCSLPGVDDLVVEVCTAGAVGVSKPGVRYANE